jgi:hypothetical protein
MRVKASEVTQKYNKRIHTTTIYLISEAPIIGNHEKGRNIVYEMNIKDILPEAQLFFVPIEEGYATMIPIPGFHLERITTQSDSTDI